MSEKSVLVLGVGNVLLGDEGVGVHAVRRLQARSLPNEVEAIDGGTIGFELAAYVRGRKKIIIVDSLHEEAQPGSVFRLTLDEIRTPLKPSPTAHNSSIDTLLQYVKTLLPQPEVIVIGIVPECIDRLHLGLSKTLEDRLEGITELIAREIQ